MHEAWRKVGLVYEFGVLNRLDVKALTSQRWRKMPDTATSRDEILEQAALYDRQGREVGLATDIGGLAAIFQLYTRTRPVVTQRAFVDHIRETGARVSYRRPDSKSSGLFLTDECRVILKPSRVALFLTTQLNQVMPADEHGRLSRAVWVEQGIVEGVFQAPNPYR